MPTGRQGQKRPLAAKSAPGDIEENKAEPGKDKAAQELGRNGRRARAERMTPERRAEIAMNAAASRWGRT
jgi:hypothetical protein